MLAATLVLSIFSNNLSSPVTGSATSTDIFLRDIDMFIISPPLYLLLLAVIVIVLAVTVIWRYFNPALPKGWEQEYVQSSESAELQRLKSYIKTAKSQKKSLKEIRQSLLSVGWSEEIVNQAFEKS